MAELPSVLRDPERLAALHGTALLDSETEEAFDRLTRLASRILGAPVALVALVEQDRQFFKSHVGLPEPFATTGQTPITHSFCKHVVLTHEPLVVVDARDVPELRENPAIEALGVVAYLGMPLSTDDGHVLGSFCVIDHEPRRWTEAEIEVLRDLAASVMSEIELRVMVREVRKERASLRESEARFRELAENIREVFWISDTGLTRLAYVSPAYEEIWGQPRAPLHDDARAWLEAVHPDDLERVRAALEGRARGEYAVEYRIVRPDGEIRWILDRAFPVRDEEGTVLRVVGIAEDVTTEKIASRERERLLEREREARGEAERRARQEKALREAAAAVSAAFTVEDTARRIAESALLATRADGAYVERIDMAAGMVEVIAAAGESAPRIGSRMPLEGSFTQLVVERGESELIPRISDTERPLPDNLDRTCQDYSAAVVPLHDTGEPIGALHLLRRSEKQAFRPDEIDRARTFGDLAALAFHKIHLLEESERKREELQRVTESRARLMRGFSHDVKNPLGAADGYLQLLEVGVRGELTEEQVSDVARARRSLGSALALIEDLLDLARAEAGQIEIELAPTDVRRAAVEMAEEYRAQAEAKGLTLGHDTPAEFPIMESDPARIRQILSNLLSNATKYTDRGGVRVEVEIQNGGAAPGPGAWSAVHVHDTGPGIPEEQREILFQEFTRLQPGAGRGAGIGLAISQKIAEALGGAITLRSVVGEGSTFTLWLPLVTPGGGVRQAG